MDKRIFLCLAITSIIKASVATFCTITDKDNCFYTVNCDIPAKIDVVPYCDYTDPYITLVINESPVHKVTANFFNTKFDAYVRILTAIENSWDAVQNNAFSNFKNVVYMDLSKNEIKSIGRAFIGLGQLNSLNLSRNHLEVLKPDVFMFSENKNRLSLLDLSYNLLSYLPDDFFVNLYNLKQLYLQGNKLTTLGDQLFSTNFKNLNYLNLCCNNFTTLNLTLKYFKSLRELNLSFNHLKEIDLSEVVSLEMIDLSHNEIDEFIFDYYEQFPGLEELDLSYNKLKKIYGSNTVQNANKTKQLVKIYLNNNNISHVDETFLNTFNIGLIDLSYNANTKFKKWRYTQRNVGSRYY